MLAVLCVLLATATSGHAQSVIDQEQPIIDLTVGGLGIGGGSEQKLAQVVTAGRSGALSEVRFPVGCSDSSELRVEIQGVSGGVPNGVVLTSETAVVPSPGNVEFTGIVFSAPVSFAAGSRFAIVLSSDGECGMFQGPVGDSYPEGNGFFDARPNQEGVWVCLCEFAGASIDLPFQTLVVPNQLPIANAGGDRVVSEGSLVTLNGAVSVDPDGSPLRYRWSQIGGPPVALSNARSRTASFRAPFVKASTVLTLQLVVNDGIDGSAPDTVRVTVRDLQGSLRGVVTANGRPVARAEVRLFRNLPLFRSAPVIRTTTDRTGFYAVTGLPPGTYWVQVGALLQAVRLSAREDRRLNLSVD
jgi:K319-like protein/carboxypeptidase family protein